MQYTTQGYVPPEIEPAAGPAGNGRDTGTPTWKRVLSLVLSAALFGAVAAGAFCGTSRLLSRKAAVSLASAGDAEPALTTLSSAASTGQESMDVSDIAAAALPGVVAITNISVQELQNIFRRFGPNGAGQPQLEETTSCGSGVIIANDGTYLYIVTNEHVVADATTLSAASGQLVPK